MDCGLSHRQKCPQNSSSIKGIYRNQVKHPLPQAKYRRLREYPDQQQQRKASSWPCGGTDAFLHRRHLSCLQIDSPCQKTNPINSHAQKPKRQDMGQFMDSCRHSQRPKPAPGYHKYPQGKKDHASGAYFSADFLPHPKPDVCRKFPANPLPRPLLLFPP